MTKYTTRNSTTRHIWPLLVAAAAVLLGGAAVGEADVRVQDIAHLQGQRTNHLMGYGLVVGLPGTGDGEKYSATMRALMSLHQRYHAPVLATEELKGNNSVALVIVEADVPEFGARSGQTIDVTVSVVGAAQSLAGGQLLTTPLQYAMFNADDPGTQYVLALAGGPVQVLNEQQPTRGVIRQGATLEEDIFYTFIDGDRLTLVLDDVHAGWPWAHMVARAINHELARPDDPQNTSATGRRVVDAEPATALGPKNVVVHIPSWELADPANYISRVMQTSLFMLPQQMARVVINRTTHQVSFTGAVTVSPTILQIPGVGTVLVGKPSSATAGSAADEAEPVEFRELLSILSAIKVPPEQLVNAIEQLHQSGSLHAQLQYE